MYNRIAAMREAISRIAKMLSEQDIKVTMRGVSAYCEYDKKTGRPTLVNLPYMPDDASDALLNATHGFLDHEVAHIFFTDYDVLKQATKLNVHSTWNVIEDCFIEKMMTRKFAGSGSNLANTGSFFIEKYIQPKLDREPDAAVGILFVCAVRAWAGQTAFRDYMVDKWEIMQPVTEALGSLTDDVIKCMSSKDCLDLAIRFTDALKKPKPEPKAEAEPEPKAEAEPKAEPEPKPEPKAEAEPKPEPKAEAEPEPKAEAEPKAEPEPKAEAEPKAEPEPKPEAGGAGSEPRSEAEKGKGLELALEGGSDSAKDDGGDSEKMDEGLPSSGSSIFDELASADAFKDFSEAVSDALSESSLKSAEASPYVVYTTEYDIVEPLCDYSVPDYAVSDMQNKVEHMVGPLQKDLERAVAAKSAASWSSGHRSGRLHTSALARLTTFGDDRIFRRKHIATSKDVAVSLLVDCSGSMSRHDKIRTAAYAAYGLSMVLDRMNMTNEILGFTTGMKRIGPSAKTDKGADIDYARDFNLFIPVLKGFGERMTTETRKRLAALSSASWLRENVDGESVQIAAQRLAQRREKRKILMVLSDGQPLCPGNRTAQRYHLKKVVEDIEKSGIDVIGIGIDSDAPAKFYTKSVVLRSIEDLPKAVIGEVKRLLMK